MNNEAYSRSELSRVVNALMLKGVITQIHESEPKARADITTASGQLTTPFLYVYGRKQKYIRLGEPVLLVAPKGKPDQGVLIPERPDPEQDEQNRRIAALERCCAAVSRSLGVEYV